MSKKPKLTKWFPVSLRPVRKGFYEALFIGDKASESCIRYWNGYGWRASANGGTTLFGFTGDKWRGLAEKPE